MKNLFLESNMDLKKCLHAIFTFSSISHKLLKIHLFKSRETQKEEETQKINILNMLFHVSNSHGSLGLANLKSGARISKMFLYRQ